MLLLASPDDVAVRLGRLLSTDEISRADPLIAEASALVCGHLSYTPPDDPPPDWIRLVVSRMVARVFTSAAGIPEPGVSSMAMTAGPFGFTRGYTAEASSGGVWLNRQDKIMLRPYSRRGRAGNVSTA